jgi:hypothetical protein
MGESRKSGMDQGEKMSEIVEAPERIPDSWTKNASLYLPSAHLQPDTTFNSKKHPKLAAF